DIATRFKGDRASRSRKRRADVVIDVVYNLIELPADAEVIEELPGRSNILVTDVDAATVWQARECRSDFYLGPSLLSDWRQRHRQPRTLVPVDDVVGIAFLPRRRTVVRHMRSQ